MTHLRFRASIVVLRLDRDRTGRLRLAEARYGLLAFIFRILDGLIADDKSHVDRKLVAVALLVKTPCALAL